MLRGCLCHQAAPSSADRWIKVQLSYNRKRHDIKIRVADSLAQLATNVTESTGVAVCDQKVKFKGKLLDLASDAANGVLDNGLINGAKLLLQVDVVQLDPAQEASLCAAHLCAVSTYT